MSFFNKSTVIGIGLLLAASGAISAFDRHTYRNNFSLFQKSGVIGKYVAPTMLPASQIPTASPDSQATLLAVRNRIDGVTFDGPLSTTLPIEWFLDRSTAIPLKVQELEMKVTGESNDDYTRELEKVNGSFIRAVGSKLNNAFLAEGFAADVMNTQNNFGYYTKRYGYTRGDEKCVATLAVSSSPYGSIYCGQYDAQQAEWLVALEPAINPDKLPDMVLFVDKLVGNFASGGSGSRWGGGSSWIATKKDGQWQKIIEGHEIPFCSVVDQLAIPTSIIENCLHEDGSTRMR